jgi:hypothetical protein
MNETIRDYIKRRVRWLFAIGILGWLSFPLSAALHLRPSRAGVGVPLLGMIVFLGAILALNYLVKCPRCATNLGRTIAMPVGLSFGSGPQVKFCPYCGVNLDEPRARSTPVPSSQNPIK